MVPSICLLVLGISANNWFLSVEDALLIIDLIAINFFLNFWAVVSSNLEGYLLSFQILPEK